MLLSACGGAIFDDIIEIEKGSEQYSDAQEGLQHTTGPTACSVTELCTGEVRASTSQNSALIPEETEQGSPSASRPWTPIWQFSLGKLGIFRICSPAPSSQLTDESIAIPAFSIQIHRPEKRVDSGQSRRSPLGQQSRLSLASLGETQFFTVNVTGNSQTSPSPLRHSLDGTTAVSHSVITDKTSHDRANSFNMFTSPTPCSNNLCFKFQKYLLKEVFLLREQNEEQHEQTKGMVQQRKREVEDRHSSSVNPRSHDDLKEEIAQLKDTIENLEQEATPNGPSI